MINIEIGCWNYDDLMVCYLYQFRKFWCNITKTWFYFAGWGSSAAWGGARWAVQVVPACLFDEGRKEKVCLMRKVKICVFSIFKLWLCWRVLVGETCPQFNLFDFD